MMLEYVIKNDHMTARKKHNYIYAVRQYKGTGLK